MPVTEIGDPRLKALFGADDPRGQGVRPTIRLPGKGVPPIVAGILIVLAAVFLFALLNARRTAPREPSVRERTADLAAGAWQPPPPLYIPPVPVAPVVVAPVSEPKPLVVATPAPAAVSVRAPPQPVYVQPVPQLVAPPPVAPPRGSAGSALVMDAGNGAPGSEAAAGAAISAGSMSPQTVGRMRASALANRSMTVPQGHLIPAVLETGFDSTRPGFARAIVSRDVRGFDGSNVLIPRGSRLIGAYTSSASRGENRAVITWTRLIRPDGMTIAMDAPSVDTVGRGGIRANVDTHFLGRLGDALLQSTFEIGRTLAGRSADAVVVVPGGGGTGAAAPQLSSGTNWEPTLTVRPGTSISVFVAHDLDFSAAGAAR